MAKPLVDGILNLSKPQGATSMDMVRLAKRLTSVKRVGHAGTLDPIATGVLPLCFGQATRLMEDLVDGHKLYQAQFKLGEATDTYDAQGTVTSEADASSVTKAQVEARLPVFTGTIMQRPPMYSALRHEGKRLYELARAGVEVERPPREVTVYSLTLEEWQPPLVTVLAECGRGFYMRTLAHDIGEELGCGAHLRALARLRTGHFKLEEAVSPQRFEEAAADGEWEELLKPPDVALLSLEAVVAEPAAERHLRSGQAVSIRSAGLYVEHLEARRAYSTDGRFLGLVRFNRGQNVWQPEKLFSLPKPSRYAPTSG